MLDLVFTWSHLLASALFGALTIFQLRRWGGDALQRPLITAFATIAVWTIFLPLLDPHNMLTALAESARNLALLAFMYGIMPVAEERARQRALRSVYAAVAAVVGLQIVVGGVIAEYRFAPAIVLSLLETRFILGITIAAGALILVHNLYGQAAPSSRAQLRFTVLGMAAMWAYELHLYTMAFFQGEGAASLFALRGVWLCLIAPLFLIGMRSGGWSVQVSRAATFQTLSAVAIIAYLVMMMSASRAMALVGFGWTDVAQIAALLIMSIGAVVMLASPRARAWVRVMAAKHLFEHRFDYRAEWLRFTNTVRSDPEQSLSLEQRVIKALADIAASPGGLLLTADSHYRLSPEAAWNCDLVLPTTAGIESLARHLHAESFILDLDALRAGRLPRSSPQLEIPDWLIANNRLWTGVPLIHADRLVGLVLLEHPAFRRALDWEDIDLFRAAGIQAASYIAEARSQQALADSRRFEEFNRRFAFILHDIKNLVSQLSLVTRNAERHADNPEFQADMVATLQSSVKKLNDLMARLSPGATRESEPPRPLEIHPLLDNLARSRRTQREFRFESDRGLIALADPSALEQALAHLVQNAVEASEPDRPIILRLFESGGDVVIQVEDRGKGMSEEFVRTRLFQPFVSTKENGFGIGAFEARSLIHAMGGRLDVESAPGEGTCFTLILPAAPRRVQSRQERVNA